MARKTRTVGCLCCAGTVQKKEVKLWRARLTVAVAFAVFAIVCIVVWKDATRLLYRDSVHDIGLATHAEADHAAEGSAERAMTTATISNLVSTAEALSNVHALDNGHSVRFNFKDLSSRDVCYGGYSPLPGKVATPDEGQGLEAMSCDSQNVCTIEECGARCDAVSGCKSFTACGAECHRLPTMNFGSCFLKTRNLTASEALGPNACGCVSVRKGCALNDDNSSTRKEIAKLDAGMGPNDVKCLKRKSLQTAVSVQLQVDSAEFKDMLGSFGHFFDQPARCNNNLLSISSKHMAQILQRKASPDIRKEILAGLPLPRLRARKRSYFLAALFHKPQVRDSFLHWMVEVVKSLFALAASEDMTNLFVSIYYIGDPGTMSQMNFLSHLLTSLGVQHKLAQRGSDDRTADQDGTLAGMRNLAMSGLFAEARKQFDRVLWLEDALFCGHGLLEQVLLAEDQELGGASADVACGMDMAKEEDQCTLSDKWSVHDVNGAMFQPRGERWAPTKYSQDAIDLGVPFQVFSCWSGVVVYRSDVFLKEGLLFRVGREIQVSTDGPRIKTMQHLECPAPETQLIYRDMWHLGYHRVVISPNSRSAYTDDVFFKCVQGVQLEIHANIPVWYRHFSPARVDCSTCSGANSDREDSSASCRPEAWRDVYFALGIPRQCGFEHLGLKKEAALPSPCGRPDNWCAQLGARFTDEQDCDGDGLPDPQCVGVGTEDRGFIASAFSCRDTWPRGVCKAGADLSFAATGMLPLPGHVSRWKSLRTPCVRIESSISNARASTIDHTQDKATARRKMLEVAGESNCNGTLLGINYAHMREIIQGTADMDLRREIIQELPKPSVHPACRKHSYYVVALLHSSEDIFPHWAVEMIKLFFALAADENMKNLYVSVYESGSNDLTPYYLATFQDVLDALGVEHTITLRGSIERLPGENRIAFLARLRNAAMKNFFSRSEGFERVVWVSDNMFCAHGLLEQILLLEDEEHGGVGAHASCGMDFGVLGPYCAFYDRWATHDMNGVMFDNLQRIASTNNSWGALKRGAPFQVFTCWGGSVVYRGDIFHKEGVLFRRSRKIDEAPPLLRKSFTRECAAAETQLIMHDMWYLGYNKIVIAPNSRSAYSQADFAKCVQNEQKSIQTGVPVHYTSQAPQVVECCELPENSHYGIEWTRCPLQDWRSVYAVHGLPRQCGFEHMERKLVNSDVGIVP